MATILLPLWDHSSLLRANFLVPQAGCLLMYPIQTILYEVKKSIHACRSLKGPQRCHWWEGGTLKSARGPCSLPPNRASLCPRMVSDWFQGKRSQSCLWDTTSHMWLGSNMTKVPFLSSVKMSLLTALFWWMFMRGTDTVLKVPWMPAASVLISVYSKQLRLGENQSLPKVIWAK